MQSSPIHELKLALDAYQKADRYHQAVGFRLVTPARLKHLALAVEPTASVHRTQARMYQCKIGGKPINGTDRVHATPVHAWAYLAAHIAKRHQSVVCVTAPMKAALPTALHDFELRSAL